MTAKKTQPAAAAKETKAAKVAAASTVGANLSAGDIDKARKEGAIQAEKKAAEDSYRYVTDGQNVDPDAPAPRQWPGKSEIMQFAHLLGLGPDAFEAAVAENADDQIAEDKVAGLLELERSGQNRTPYVKACMARLKVESPYEVTSAGPDYTNDVRPVSAL